MGFLEKAQQKKHIDKTNDDKTIIADEEYRVEKDREKDQIDKTEEERITSTIDEINEGQEGKTGLLAKIKQKENQIIVKKETEKESITERTFENL